VSLTVRFKLYASRQTSEVSASLPVSGAREEVVPKNKKIS
jgi:hypothetical protein